MYLISNRDMAHIRSLAVRVRQVEKHVMAGDFEPTMEAIKELVSKGIDVANIPDGEDTFMVEEEIFNENVA